MNASSKNSAADQPSETKNAFDDDRYSTLPNFSGEEVRKALPEGSVMWDGPPSSEGGARSAVPAHQGTPPSYAAGAVTNSPTAVREVNLVTVPATPDAEHKSAEITPANGSSSSKEFVSDKAKKSANDRLFYITPLNLVGLSALLKNIMPASPEAAVNWLRLRMLIDEVHVHGTSDGDKAPLDMSRAATVLERISTSITHRKQQRKERQDSEPSRQTIAGYEHDCAVLNLHRQQVAHLPTEQAWALVMSQHAASRSTFHTYRAALIWQAYSYLETLLRICEALFKRYGDAVLAPLFPYLDQAHHEWQVRSSLDRKLCLQISGKPARKKKSRSEDLQYLPEGWMDRFLVHCETSPTYRDASVLLRFSGIRPCELAKGVQVTLQDDRLIVRIKGGKVRGNSGQPWREMVLDAHTMPRWFLDEFSRQPIRFVQVNADSMRAYLGSLTQRVLQGAKDKKGKHINLSAYLFRHAVTTDFRQCEWTKVEMSAVLGQVSAATSNHYGEFAPSKGARRIAIDKTSVRTARPVKPVDTAGLQQLLADKAPKKARKNLS